MLNLIFFIVIDNDFVITLFLIYQFFYDIVFDIKKNEPKRFVL